MHLSSKFLSNLVKYYSPENTIEEIVSVLSKYNGGYLIIWQLFWFPLPWLTLFLCKTLTYHDPPPYSLAQTPFVNNPFINIRMCFIFTLLSIEYIMGMIKGDCTNDCRKFFFKLEILNSWSQCWIHWSFSILFLNEGRKYPSKVRLCISVLGIIIFRI